MPLEFSKSTNEDIEEAKNLIDQKYTPRTGQFEIEVFPRFRKDYKVGEKLEVIFKDKEKYYKDYSFEVGFIYAGDLIAIESEFYSDNKPLIRIVRAHFSGIEIKAEIIRIENRVLIVSIQFAKDGHNLEGKVVREKSDITRGKFDVVGFHYLPDNVKEIMWKELKVGDELTLVADSKNEYDGHAIKVLYKQYQIGWVSKQYGRKDILFHELRNGKEVTVRCIGNYRGQDYRKATRPDKNGNWNDEYLGMAQFVEAEFEMDKL